MRELQVQPLLKADFAPYGDVVEMEGAQLLSTNRGFASRADRLAKLDIPNDATANVSLFVALARPLPIRIELMERHPLASQLFFPLQPQPWLVVVCSDPSDPASFRAFKAHGRQGVNYARNVWHHPLLVLGDDQRFLVIDRPGADNLDEAMLGETCDLRIARA
jgi:ureidoglycolate lyase